MMNLLAAAAVAASAPSLSASAPGHPAMFVVRDADTTVYLFGTFHALDDRTDWFGTNVRAALDQSDELVLETLLPERPAVPIAASYRVPASSLTAAASFLPTTRMTIEAARSQHMQVDTGADMVLRRTAEAEGKPVGALEPLQFQIDMFRRMPPTPRGQAPTRNEPTGGLPRSMTDMESAWKRGDQHYFAGLLEQLRTGSPTMYRTIFAERNARWAEWIVARMQVPGTVFVAVGAGHLAGSDSVLVRLAEKGIPSQRVN